MVVWSMSTVTTSQIRRYWNDQESLNHDEHILQYPRKLKLFIMLSELESEMFMKSKTGISFWPENSTSFISMRPKKNIPSDEKRIRLAIPHQSNRVLVDGLTWLGGAKLSHSSWLALGWRWFFWKKSFRRFNRLLGFSLWFLLAIHFEYDITKYFGSVQKFSFIPIFILHL